MAIFFVISGALLYLPYARAIGDRADAAGLARLRAGRRAVRILPAYWVALTAVAIGPFDAGRVRSGHRQLLRLCRRSITRRPCLGGLGVAWSLCVEVSFYALLPVFAWLVARTTGRSGGRAARRRPTQVGRDRRIGVAGPARRARRLADRAQRTTAADADGEPARPARLVCDRNGARRAPGRARGRTCVQVPAYAVLGRRPWVCVALGVRRFHDRDPGAARRHLPAVVRGGDAPRDRRRLGLLVLARDRTLGRRGASVAGARARAARSPPGWGRSRTASTCGICRRSS